MNAAVVEFQEPAMPPAVARRGINDAQWRTLMNNLFPGAKGESVLMVWDYCIARKLDPMKKPCHIVPMSVKDARTGDYVYRDVVMPGIYEYRTTAQRTGEYLGHSPYEYGPASEYKKVSAPEWCSVTMYRWNPVAKMRAEFPVKVKFKEIAATKRNGDINERWTDAPEQMLTKCTEAAGLREGFPDELGGTHTVEEMEGRTIIDAIPVEPEASGNPRGDVSGVDWELRDKHVKALAEILDADKEERDIHQLIYDYVKDELMRFPELFITVNDKLAADKVISKASFRKLYDREPLPLLEERIP